MNREIRSFVMRAGKMSKGQRQAYEEYRQKWAIEYKEETLNLPALSDNRPVILEIGFGMGDATWQIAKANPDNFYLGAEVHRPGVGKLLARIESEGIENLRILEHDVKQVMDKMIPQNGLSGIHIFFPDPWPKKKHHKRRLIQNAFIKEVLDRILPGGYLYVVTDWQPYAEHILQVLENNQDLHNPYDGYAEPQSWRPETAFERKGLQKSHSIFEFYYIKK